MIENKELFERMAAEWIKEFMFTQREFTSNDILNTMPLKHLGIDFDKVEFGDKQKDYLWDLVDEMIPIYAPRYGYAKDAHNVWRQSNMKPEPIFDSTANSDQNFTITGGNVTIPVVDDEKDFSMVAPFDNFCKKLRALLGQDPDVTVLGDSDKKVINICVAGCNKPDAYRVYFPGEMNIKNIGTVKVLINGHAKSYRTHADETILRAMFADNPIVKDIKVTTFNTGDKNRLFVIFKNNTIQFKNDNFGSPWNVTTTTAEILAKDVMPNASETNTVIWWTTDYDGEEVDNQYEKIQVKF